MKGKVFIGLLAIIYCMAQLPVAAQETESGGQWDKRSQTRDFFFDSAKSADRSIKRIGNMFAGSTADSGDWPPALDKMTDGGGLSHLLTSILLTGVIICCGLLWEFAIRRPNEGLRRLIIRTVTTGSLQFLGRVASRILLDAFYVAMYIMATFLMFVLLLDDGSARYAVVGLGLLGTYYLRVVLFAARCILSPQAPAVRLLPLQEKDSRFLYRWFVFITFIAGIPAISALILKTVGASENLFVAWYSAAGMTIILSMVLMVWQSRKRVAEVICPPMDDNGRDPSPLQVKLARNWHFLAIFYVAVSGAFWQVSFLSNGQGRILKLVVSLFLIPVFIGFDNWMDKLLKIASGDLPETFDLNVETVAQQTEGVSDENKKNIGDYIPFLRKLFRFFLAALMFFTILRLWEINMPFGWLVTSNMLSILIVLMLAIAVWEYVKIRITQKLKQEMPDDDQDMEEGGAGGSRSATLLLLLRKFLLAVLVVITGLTILSSIGVDIGPLIAGAGIFGLAIGFGAQTLVKDIIAGIFFLIDDAFRLGDYVEAGNTKGTVEQISIRSMKMRHPRGMVHTIPFGSMGTLTNFSRDYIITKLTIRVRFDANIDKIRKIIKKINQELSMDDEIGPVLLSKIKSQGIKEMDDSAMIIRVKFKTIPGQQFVVRREVFQRIQKKFKENGIDFAHRNVTVYLPPEIPQEPDKHRESILGAGAAATASILQTEKEKRIDQSDER